MKNILITGGLGYIGLVLTKQLLDAGYRVATIDSMLHGGPMPYTHKSSFESRFFFIRGDLRRYQDIVAVMTRAKPDAVVHLAALVGYPMCRRVGGGVSHRYNVEGTENVFEAANHYGAKRFVFASTYSVYGKYTGSDLVTEMSPLNPQSIYAETKIAAEKYLWKKILECSACAPVILRFATLYGLSPRMRFDLIINQFLMQAHLDRKLMIYEPDFRRSFLHVQDAARAICLAIEAPLETVGGEVFNVGGEGGNLTKREVVSLVCSLIDDVEIEYRELSVDGDMRDIGVSYEKIRRALAFYPEVSFIDGMKEVLEALESGAIPDPTGDRYKNNKALLERCNG